MMNAIVTGEQAMAGRLRKSTSYRRGVQWVAGAEAAIRTLWSKWPETRHKTAKIGVAQSVQHVAQIVKARRNEAWNAADWAMHGGAAAARPCRRDTVTAVLSEGCECP
jgi:hypothetical protein